MSTEVTTSLPFEIGHVLFIDLVGYSKLLIDDQRELQQQLNQTVRDTEQFRAAEAAGKLVRLPTGDGMALVFFTTPEAPVQCALEISEALQEHFQLRDRPHLRLRMGINTGPVSGVADVNDKSNVAGAGINIAQRIMDVGDAGHILLSKRAAEDLAQYRHWEPHLHDLGEWEVKHGVRISIVNLSTGKLGNPELPEKLKQQARQHVAQRRRRKTLIAGLVLLAVALPAGALICWRQSPSKLSNNSTASAPEKSIAVLPFENLSRDPDNAYFADGIQEEILTRLAKIADLKVISRTSTQNYKSKPGNLSEIAQQLSVANILEGSVQKVGDQVRVNVQLINAKTDSHLWADIYDRKLKDILAVESEIAKAITESLQAKLSGSERQALVVKPTNNSEAYDAYFRGLTANDWDKAIQFYERAVQLDPGFTVAWGQLSQVHAIYYFNRGTATQRDAAERTLSTAQKLQPNAPETLLAQAYFQYWVRRDYEAAKTAFGLVRNVLPGSSEVPAALALIVRRQGHWDESITYWEQSLALDPLNIDWLAECGWTYRMLRQFPAALSNFDRALTVRPNDPYVVACKVGVYQSQGDLQQAGKLLAGLPVQSNPVTDWRKSYQLILERHYDEAIRMLKTTISEVRQVGGSGDLEVSSLQVSLADVQRLAYDSASARATAQEAQPTLERLCKKEPDNPWRAVNLSQLYAVIGEKDAALREAERAVTLLPSAQDAVSGPHLEENLAYVQARCGEKDRPISALQHLLSMPYGYAPITKALLRIDPVWDDLRGDPRFQKLVEEK